LQWLAVLLLAAWPDAAIMQGFPSVEAKVF